MVVLCPDDIASNLEDERHVRQPLNDMPMAHEIVLLKTDCPLREDLMKVVRR